MTGARAGAVRLARWGPAAPDWRRYAGYAGAEGSGAGTCGCAGARAALVRRRCGWDGRNGAGRGQLRISHAPILRRSASDATEQSHPVVHVRERGVGDGIRPGGVRGEDAVELGRVVEELERAGAHRFELVDDDLGETLLEVAVAPTRILVFDRPRPGGRSGPSRSSAGSRRRACSRGRSAPSPRCRSPRA